MKWIAFFQSSIFKRMMMVVGIIFIILTAVISFDPSPFLKFGYPGIFVFNLFGPGTLLVPTLVKHFNPVLIAILSALGMALNDSVSWLVGAYGHQTIPHTLKVKGIEKSITTFGTIALFFWSLIPFPYDLIGLISGYLGLPYQKFIIPTILGKFIRLILLGYGILNILH